MSDYSHLNDDCLFCKIIKGDIPSKKVYEDESVYAFEDINPTAPVHILFIPKCHIESLNDIKRDLNGYLVGDVYAAITKVTRQMGLDESGYRVVSNCGKDAGQTVPHIHFHLLAGRELTWPAG